MDTLATKMFEFFIASGTISSFIMLGLLVIIYGYFKYIKPFLKDWNDLKVGIISRETSYVELVSATKDVCDVIDSLKIDIAKISAMIRSDIESHNVKTVETITRELEKLQPVVLRISEQLKNNGSYDQEKMNQVILELTKINLRIEMNQNNGQLRGMK